MRKDGWKKFDFIYLFNLFKTMMYIQHHILHDVHPSCLAVAILQVTYAVTEICIGNAMDFQIIYTTTSAK